eukprot:XP_001697609.1 CTP synthase [Chlamydomonas reinhardtii]
MQQTKYVLVTGGVVSGLGKGVTASSVGVLLKNCGYRVTSIKIDPYINVDAGTMSPFEHGEVFVLDDGGEADLDLGNYERFLDITLTRDNNITTGKIYQAVIERERRGDYLGKTVQVVPHITDAIQDWIQRVAARPVDGNSGVPHVCVIELGGTEPLEESVRTKLALFCNVPEGCVLSLHDVSNIWRVPLLMQEQNVHHLLCTKLGLTAADKLDLSVWKANLADRWDSLTEPIAVIEFARNVLGLKEANSTEFAPACPHPAVVFMPEISTTHLGGTMRLVQSRPGKPSPLFLGFILASAKRLDSYLR